MRIREYVFALAIGSCVLGGCVLGGCVEQGGDRSPEGQWRALFDGHTLDGWTPKIRGHALGDNYRDTFRVQDGAIRVSYDRYDQFSESYGHLFYQAPFRFYRLRLEYRFYAPPLPETPDWARYNSGVMILSQPPETMAQSASFPVSIEAQILGPVEGEARTNGNVCTPGTHIVLNGQLETRHCINSRTSAQPNGQWHSIEIDVLPDGRIIHRLNGAVVMEYSGAQLDPDGGMADSKPLVAAQDGRTDIVDGYISLQSEGSPIEFRNIEVMTLD